MKAGKMVLLALLLLGVSGAFSQIHAQEKLLEPFTFQKVSHKCTSIDDYLLTKKTLCEESVLTQVELAVKSQAQENLDTAASFSYSTEPTLYVPPTPTETPTITPTETPVLPSPPQPNQTPQNNVPAHSPSLNSDTIFDLINAHRAQIGKPAFQKDGQLCSLASTRSMELDGELFGGKGYLHSGLYNRNLPYWITEDAKWGSNEAGTVQWWLNSPIHRAAIEGDYTYSCGACNGSMCSQLFTSYIPKGGATVSNSTAQTSNTTLASK